VLTATEISTYMSSNAVDDLNAPDPSGPGCRRRARPLGADMPGRGRRTVGWRGTPRDGERPGHLCVTAPLVIEAAFQVLVGAGDTAGVASVGARFDAKDFLGSLSLEHLTFE
jgi:hypothetical protein